LILNQAEPIQLMRSVERMGKIAAAHLKQVLDAYANQDLEAAISVWHGDDSIDALYNSLFRELLTYMIEDPRTISSCAHLLFIAKNLERVGDHGTNIAEYIHFLVTGEEIATQRPRADAEAVE
jgi:phosphate transport system protein